NDGLVSNLSLVMGVAGAAVSEKTILLTGLAGLVAGACSMAMGEWLSVNSARELAQKQIEIERAELEQAPEEEIEEIALIYDAKGLPRPQAEALARQRWRTRRPRSTRWCARSLASIPTSSAARPGPRRPPHSSCFR